MAKHFDSSTDGPWYKNADFWLGASDRFMAAYISLSKEALERAEIDSYGRLASVRLVFESNLIEGAGLSAGETKRLIDEYFPAMPAEYQSFKRQMQWLCEGSMGDRVRAYLEEAHRLGVPDFTMVEAPVHLGTRGKRMWDTLCHFVAFAKVEGRSLQFKLDTYGRVFAEYLVAQGLPDREVRERWAAFSQKPWEGIPPQPALLTEEWIRDLHSDIAWPTGTAKKPAAYRNDEVCIAGVDLALPGPDLVPHCMARFVEDSNELVWHLRAGADQRRESIAARISYEFARIHPFFDYNGRLSRLLLNLVLFATDVPFAVVVRGNSRSKQRYMRSLRYANGGNLVPYSALVAMRIAESFAEVDENLALAGLEPLWSRGLEAENRSGAE